MLSEVISFIIKSKVKKRTGFSKTSIYWISSMREKFSSPSKLLSMPYLFSSVNAFILLVAWCLKKRYCITMSINPAPFCANIFLYSFNLSIWNNFYHLDPTKVYKYRVSRFIDNFSAISNDKDFLTSFEKFTRKEPELKIEHQENHTSSLDLDIK